MLKCRIAKPRNVGAHTGISRGLDTEESIVKSGKIMISGISIKPATIVFFFQIMYYFIHYELDNFLFILLN